MSELKTNKITPATGTTVTLGDAGDTIVNNGTASGFLPTVGSSGNVLTSDGTNWASTAPAGGGAWSVISSGTFSSVSSLDMTGFSSTKPVKFFIHNITQSSAESLLIRTSTNGGSSFDNGGSDYECAFHNLSVGSSYIHAAGGPGGGSSSISTSDAHHSTGSNRYIEITMMDQGQVKPTVFLFSSFIEKGDNILQQVTGIGQRVASSDVDGVQVKPNGGTFNGSYVVIELN